MKFKRVSDVVVDVRERERSVRGSEFYRNHDLRVITRMLPFGDYVFNEKVVWEYKTWADFIGSIINSSVFNEVFNQTGAYEYSFLIIVGDLEKEILKAYYNNPVVRNRYPSMQRYKNQIREMIKGAIRRCRTVCNVVTVRNEKEAFIEMAKQSDKCLDGKRYGGIVRKTKKTDLSPFEVFLSCIGGIGDVTSEKIVTEFNITCLDDLLNITYNDLIEHGIHRDKAKAYCKYIYNDGHLDK